MANSPIIYGPNGATSLVPGGVTLPGATSGTLQVQPAAVTTSYGLVMPSVQGTANSLLKNDGTGALTWALGGTAIAPTVTKYLSGSGTYTTPAGVSYIKVTMVGGGAGGQGGGTGSGGGAPGAGVASTFGTSLLIANGGNIPPAGGFLNGGTGGTAIVNSPALQIAAVQGGSGESGYGTGGTSYGLGGVGGSSFFGGAGGGGGGTGLGLAAVANSGSGGGAGGSQDVSTGSGGNAGGAGGYVDALITSPVSSYSYTVGTGGTGGTAGSSGSVGGAGGSGVIVIQEFYSPVVISTAAGGAIPPTVTKFLSGSGSYTPSAGITSIKVTMVGGGAGGLGGGTSSTTSGAGGTTTFGTSLLTATGGTGGAFTGSSTGGTATVNTPAITIKAITGATGGTGYNQTATNSLELPAGMGGVSPLGGAGATGFNASSSGNAQANTGSGGGGGNTANNVAMASGGGGGAGGYIEAYIPNPSGSYAWTVGTSGAGGVGTTSTGGNGGSGVIIIEESYANGAVGTATSITGSITASQISTNVPTSNISGTTTNNNAAAGLIGEYISANSVGVTPAASGSYVNIASISLTAGDWDVEGLLSFAPGASTTSTGFQGGVSLTSATLDSLTSGSYVTYEGASVSSSPFGSYNVSTGNRRVSIAATTTVYLVGDVAYSALGTATWSGSSIIRARRVR